MQCSRSIQKKSTESARASVTRGSVKVIDAPMQVYDALGQPVLAARVIYLELKSKRGALSAEQEDVIARLAACGVPTLVCRSIEEVSEGLTGLGVPLNGRVM